MQPEIIYKSIRHGYARINKEGNLQLCIPSRLRGNQTFLADLLKKGQKLIKRYESKNHVQTIDVDSVILFWEQVPVWELATTPKKLPSRFKQTLYDYSKPILDEYSKTLGIDYRDLKIRKTKSKRWSCTFNQHISLNQDLIHLPTRLIKYVIIHEACHLKIKDHSTKFRKLVETYCPNYKLLRKELRNTILK